MVRGWTWVSYGIRLVNSLLENARQTLTLRDMWKSLKNGVNGMQAWAQLWLSSSDNQRLS